MTKPFRFGLFLTLVGFLTFVDLVSPATAQSPERDLSVSFSTKHDGGTDPGFAMGTVTNKSDRPYPCVRVPPPGPSPEAVLNVRKEADNPLDVTVNDTIVDAQRLRLSFSASPRRVEITDAGEMKWQTERGYRALYWVYWD